jgi:hypothetical protein
MKYSLTQIPNAVDTEQLPRHHCRLKTLAQEKQATTIEYLPTAVRLTSYIYNQAFVTPVFLPPCAFKGATS